MVQGSDLEAVMIQVATLITKQETPKCSASFLPRNDFPDPLGPTTNVWVRGFTGRPFRMPFVAILVMGNS